MPVQASQLLSLAEMEFPKRLSTLRKERGMTQDALSEASGIHVVQIRRYETAKAQPTFEVLRKLTKGLGVTGDALLFDEDERGPQRESIRLRLEAIDRLDDDEIRVIEQVLDGMLLKHEARRYATAS